MRAAVVDLSSNLVVNVVRADAGTDAAPDGCLFVNSDVANIGDSWNGTQIVARVVPVVSAMHTVKPTTASPNVTAL